MTRFKLFHPSYDHKPAKTATPNSVAPPFTPGTMLPPVLLLNVGMLLFPAFRKLL